MIFYRLGILEDKMSKVEESALNSFKASSTETSTLKEALKNLRIELEMTKKEVNTKNKVIKEKEKEIYRVVQKSENLNDTITKSKLEINSLKAEIKKLKKKPEKKVSTASVSTNTVQPTPTFCSPACKKLIPKSPIFSSNVTLPSSKPSASVSKVTCLNNNSFPTNSSPWSQVSSLSSNSCTWPELKPKHPLKTFTTSPNVSLVFV